MWQDVLMAAYAAFGFVGVAAFVPQLISLLRDTTRSENISVTTWLMWSAQVSVFFLYALFMVGDLVMVAIYACSMVVCNACTAALLWNRCGRSWWVKNSHRFTKVTSPMAATAEAMFAPVAATAEAVAQTSTVETAWETAAPVVENAWEAVSHAAPVEMGPTEDLLPSEWQELEKAAS